MKHFQFILAINPGSTSTKISLYENDICRDSTVVWHEAEQIGKFKTIWEQSDFRLSIVRQWCAQLNIQIDAVVGSGGLLKPLSSGTYQINAAMLADARRNLQGEHASNIGCYLASELAKEYRCNAYVVDPVSVDESEPLARYSGHPSIQRNTLSHALSIHAAARRAVKELQIDSDHSSLIVAHLGGGISIAAVKNNRIIDVNDASSDGPFSPERSGGLPLQQFISLCFSGKYSEGEVRKMVMGNGGLLAYLGTNSAKEVEQRIEAGDGHAAEIFQAMAYQIAKEIGAMNTVLYGRAEALILTGGLASSHILVEAIQQRTGFIDRVLIYPIEDEMLALVSGVLRVLSGEEQVKEY